MLRLKAAFYFYDNEINGQIKKSITEKIIGQIAQCVLDDITEMPNQDKPVQEEGKGTVGKEH